MENLGNPMTPPKLPPEEKPQTLEFVQDNNEQQGPDFLPESDEIDATGNPVNQKSITNLLIQSEFLLYQGE